MPILGIMASQISGHLWAPSGAYDSIATASGAGASSVTFSSIPSTYTHLQIRILSRTERPVAAQSLWMQVNGDAGSNYSWHALEADGSAVSANAGANQTIILAGVTTGSSATSGMFATCVIDILDYANTNKNKTVRSLSGFDLNGSGGVQFYSGNWRNTNAITSISLISPSNNFISGSSFALYGIKGN